MEEARLQIFENKCDNFLKQIIYILKLRYLIWTYFIFSFAHLMCGQFGLVHAMLYIFSYGYKSARLFGRNLSVWDFFLKVTMDFNQSLPHLYTTSSNSNQNSPHPSPRRGHYTLESPKRLQGLTMSSLLDSPKRTLGAGGVSPNIPQGATLSRSNQFRRYFLQEMF